MGRRGREAASTVNPADIRRLPTRIGSAARIGFVGTWPIRSASRLGDSATADDTDPITPAEIRTTTSSPARYRREIGGVALVMLRLDARPLRDQRWRDH